MQHEQSNEAMIESETASAPETATANREESSTANEEASSPEKKRAAPEEWENEAISNHHDDTEDTIQMTADEEQDGGKEMEEEEESPAAGKENEAEQSTGNAKLSVDTSSSPSIVPQRPVKKARTAYFIFAEEKRPELQKQNTGVGVTGMAKLIGQLWSSLSAEDKKIYQDKATAERERVAQDLQAWKAAGGIVDETTATSPTSDPNALTFPAARIRKICKLDPDVKNLSKEALLLVCKAAELALSQLGRESVKVAQIQNRRKLVPDDIATVCNTREQFLFLREDIQDLARAAAAQQQQQQTTSKGKSGKADGKPQGRPITDFFAPKSVQ